MKAYRKTAIVVGVLFILATALALLSGTFIGSVLGAPHYLANAAASSGQMILGALLEVGAAISVALIPAALFPVLKQQNEGMALGYFAFRIIEAITLVVGAISALLLITLGQKYAGAAALGAPYFQTLGDLLLATRSWVFPLNPIVFGPGSLLFNVALFQSRLIPRWLSAWGILGAVLVFAAGVAGLFGSFSTPLAIPIGVQEMVFAVWLIVKGFNPSALASGSA